VGPELALLDAKELKRFGDLRLRLSVSGHERQNALVEGDMLYRPLQALQSLTQFQELAPGDLILTGTGRYRAERPAETVSDHRKSITAGHQMEGVLQASSRQSEISAAR
jgi:2-keto-4-pentenoate hydratase/2-oxohepta-3-ene-1,7-dioic acid hydratase in catechol pathway